MKRIEINPNGLKDPICECGTNEWTDTKATLGYAKIMQCSQCGKNRVCE